MRKYVIEAIAVDKAGKEIRAWSEIHGAVFTIPHKGKHSAEHEANAKLIVKAVNSYDKLIEENKRLSQSNKELLEALDGVVRIFIYSSKKEFGFDDKVKITEKAVQTLLKNGVNEIGKIYDYSKNV